MKHLIMISLLAVTLVTSSSAQGIVSGFLADDSGTALAGEMVELHPGPTLSAGAATTSTGRMSAITGFSSATTTDTDGSFSFSSVPAGNYYVCAYSITPGLLSNCQWQSHYTALTIGTAGTSGVPLVMTRGTVITLNLQDPNGLLAGTAHHFYPGLISASGYYTAAQLVSSGSTSRVYAATIPNSATMNILIDSDLVVSDISGTTLALRQPSSVVVLGGTDVTVDLFVQ